MKSKDASLKGSIKLMNLYQTNQEGKKDANYSY